MQTPSLLRFAEVSRLVGLSKSEIYRRVRAEKFPRPIPIGTNASAWASNEVEAWIQARIAERDSGPAKRRLCAKKHTEAPA